MPLPVVLIPVAISAVRSLIRYRIRVDHILAVRPSTTPIVLSSPTPAFPPLKSFKALSRKKLGRQTGKGKFLLRRIGLTLALTGPRAPSNSKSFLQNLTQRYPNA